jgi:hypothetical protein
MKFELINIFIKKNYLKKSKGLLINIYIKKLYFKYIPEL